MGCSAVMAEQNRLLHANNCEANTHQLDVPRVNSLKILSIFDVKDVLYVEPQTVHVWALPFLVCSTAQLDMLHNIVL